MVNIAQGFECSKGCKSFTRCGGDHGSEASGKVANREVRTEVSQTAVSVLTNRNYIPRLYGRMR